MIIPGRSPAQRVKHLAHLFPRCGLAGRSVTQAWYGTSRSNVAMRRSETVKLTLACTRCWSPHAWRRSSILMAARPLIGQADCPQAGLAFLGLEGGWLARVGTEGGVALNVALPHGLACVGRTQDIAGGVTQFQYRFRESAAFRGKSHVLASFAARVRRELLPRPDNGNRYQSITARQRLDRLGISLLLIRRQIDVDLVSLSRQTTGILMQVEAARIHCCRPIG